VRVVIADDKQIVRFGVRTALAAERIEIVAEAANGRDAIEQVRVHRPDVLLLELQLPLLDGAAAIREAAGLTRVLMLTGVHDQAAVLHALAAGARGYLVHGEFLPADLAAAVIEVASGRSILSPHAATALVNRLQKPGEVPARLPATGLTRRESEIMALIAEGLSNRQIAERLVISEKTVKNHIVSIYRRFGVASRGQAISSWYLH
jgi:DNA-binding NarL/FixJ family response regulator